MTDKLLACPNCKSTDFIRKMEEEMIVKVADLGKDGFEDRDGESGDVNREYVYFCAECQSEELDLEECPRVPLKGEVN